MGSLERHRNKLSVLVCKELFVPTHLQWLKLLLHVFSDSPFVMLPHRGGGHTNHLLFQASPRTCLIVVAVIGQRVSFGWLRSLLCDSGGTSREGELRSVAVVVSSLCPDIALMVSQGWAVGEATSMSCSWQHLKEFCVFFMSCWGL